MILNPVQALSHLGQSIWLDNLSHRLIASGELAQHIAHGVTGLTSNPSIFAQAFAQEPYYAEAKQRLSQPSPEMRYEALVLADIQAACDAFLPIYHASQGQTGYVSLELSPTLAADEAGSVVAARRLWTAVNRPNVMIKIPATPAGIQAFETVTVEGINVNMTLIFSQKQTEAVWQAHLNGLTKRAHQGKSVDRVRAVASLFLSRVDVAVDAHLPPELHGKTAIAQASTTYAQFQTLYHGAGFAELAKLGAKPQSLLWASTATKNPAFSDVLYVEHLVGADTINTLPNKTLTAFLDHGQATLSLPHADATAHLANLTHFGVNLPKICDQLLLEGLDSFETAFEQLMDFVR
ncbi:MAG: transaldolase [Neisseriaceae bacterium]|nr:transaldolase [Neisseriaceae bacterium]